MILVHSCKGGTNSTWNFVMLGIIAVIGLSAMPGCALRTLDRPRIESESVRTKETPLAKPTNCVWIVRQLDKYERFDLRINNLLPVSTGASLLKKKLSSGSWASGLGSDNIHDSIQSPFRTDDTSELMHSAKRMGCSHVLAYTESVRARRSVNAFAALYLTIIGLYLVPGHNTQVLTQWDLKLWDVSREQKLLEDRWAGVSRLHVHRPGSSSWVFRRAYEESVIDMVASGEARLPQ